MPNKVTAELKDMILTALSDAKVYLENRNQERDIRGVRGTNRA